MTVDPQHLVFPVTFSHLVPEKGAVPKVVESAFVGTFGHPNTTMAPGCAILGNVEAAAHRKVDVLERLQIAMQGSCLPMHHVALAQQHFLQKEVHLASPGHLQRPLPPQLQRLPGRSPGGTPQQTQPLPLVLVP